MDLFFRGITKSFIISVSILVFGTILLLWRVIDVKNQELAKSAVMEQCVQEYANAHPLRKLAKTDEEVGAEIMSRFQSQYQYCQTRLRL